MPEISKDEQVEAYITSLFVHEDAALLGALDNTRAAGMPNMQVTSALGKLLCVLAQAVQAKKILEIGALGGYSGIWLSRALAPGGKLITLEANPRHADVARRSFAEAGLADHVEVRVGAALATLPTLQPEAPFDLIYIDADKANYPAYLEWAIKLAHPGTLIIGDNVVRLDAILPSARGSEDAEGIREFNQRAATDARLDAIILPNRKHGLDGILVAVVKAHE